MSSLPWKTLTNSIKTPSCIIILLQIADYLEQCHWLMAQIGNVTSATLEPELCVPLAKDLELNREQEELAELHVMLVGDSGVGKTCLLVRFKDGAFLAGSFISTVGIDFRIWDTAGQERFRSVTHAYYRDAHALLLLYDVTNKASFDNIQAWLTEIHEYAQQDVVLMLLGNKVDSAQDRVVKREDGEKLAKEYGVPFMETSAKSGLNVELAFTAIAKELKHRSMKLPNEPKFKLHDYVKKEVRGSGCCRS
ncbi:Ras-related protein Rab-26 [Pitangus sulphuratus]|nr:Ras-related protein Rab-26 [Pitangus sulphuratus]